MNAVAISERWKGALICPAFGLTVLVRPTFVCAVAISSPSVLVIGGGPIGLTLAGDLGWRGISCLLVEKGDGRRGMTLPVREHEHRAPRPY